MDKQIPDFLHLGRDATERSPLPLVVTAGIAHIVSYVNPAFCGLCGKANEELIGNPFAEVVPAETENGCLALLDRVYRTGTTETLTDQELSPYPASPVYWSYTAWAIRTEEEEHPVGVMLQVTDTTVAARDRQKLSEISEALTLSGVRQHELMATVEERSQYLRRAMRETDHRVKNNLQMIGALLDMQIMAYADTVPVAELTQLRVQIQALASVHEMLVQDIAQDPTVSILSAQQMLQKLVPMLQQIVGKWRIVWKADEVGLTSKQASSLALLISELVSNAIKHGGKQVELRLAAVAESVMLEVLDDGPGFAPAFDPRTAANFGLDLVETLSRHDLGGQTAYENRSEGGARVRITFPCAAQA